MLRPEHFKGMRVQMKHGGLTFKTTIDADVRGWSAVDLEMTYAAQQKYFEYLDKSRGPSVAKVNPRQPCAKVLTALIEQSMKGEVHWRNGIPKNGYKRKWLREYKTKGYEIGINDEGQQLIVVIYAGKKPVGYADLRNNVRRERGSREYHLNVNAEFTYIIPKFRGKGYGLDLSIACGQIVNDFLHAVYKAVPAGSSIVPLVAAEIYSKGGEAFAYQLIHELEIGVDVLNEIGGRRTVTIENVENEAGW